MIVNGAVIRNPGNQRMPVLVENMANIIREADIIDREEARKTLSGETYRLLQSCLLYPDQADTLIPVIHDRIARLLPVLSPPHCDHLMTSATHTSCRHFYKAMSALKPVIDREHELLAFAKTAEREPLVE